MTISRNISVMAQGASSSGILAGGYGGLGASVSPTTAGNVVFTADGSVWSSTAKIVRGTAVASTSGTSIDFTSIPSWVKRITVMLNTVGTNGTVSNIQLQIGSGSVTTTGYTSQSSNAAINTGVITTGFVLFNKSQTTYYLSGAVQLFLIGSNTWTSTGVISYTTVAGANWITAGNSPALAGALDRVRLTTVNGTDTFNSGSVNILYE